MDLQMTGIIDKQLIDGFDCVFGCSHRLILGFRISGFRKTLVSNWPNSPGPV